MKNVTWTYSTFSLALFSLTGCFELSTLRPCSTQAQSTQQIARVAALPDCSSIQCDLRVFSPQYDASEEQEELGNNVRLSSRFFDTAEAIEADGPQPDYDRSEVFCLSGNLRTEKMGSVESRDSLLQAALSDLRAQCQKAKGGI